MKSEAPTLHLPVVGPRDWLTGAWSVAGAVGACSLMLLACSWFVLGTEHADPSGDVGAPTPVRIDDTTPRDAGARARAVPAAPAPRRARAVHARVAPPVPWTPSTGPTVRPSHATPVASASPPVTPTPAPAPAQAQTPTSTPALPATLVSPPAVTVPSISVSLPQVPGVPLPAVTVTTPQLGSP